MTKAQSIFAWLTVALFAACAVRAYGETFVPHSGLNVLSAGTHTMDNAPKVTDDDVEIRGTPGQTFLVMNPQNDSGDASMWGIQIKGNRFKITGVRVIGGNIFSDHNGGMNDGMIVDNCEFQDAAIVFTVGWQNSKITNNLFTGSSKGGGHGYGIFGYNYKNFTLANNEFTDISAGAHIDAQSNSGPALVEQNYLRGVHGMGLEFQGASAGNVYQDNWFEKPTLSTTASENTSSMAFSLILDKSTGPTKITRNVVIAPERPDGKGVRDGFEVGGDATDVWDNYVNGTECALADNDGVGTGSVVARDCRFTGYLIPPYIAFPTPTRTLTVTNCGPTVALSPEMERRIAAGDRPGRNKRYLVTPPPTTVPVYIPTWPKTIHMTAPGTAPADYDRRTP